MKDGTLSVGPQFIHSCKLFNEMLDIKDDVEQVGGTAEEESEVQDIELKVLKLDHVKAVKSLLEKMH